MLLQCSRWVFIQVATYIYMEYHLGPHMCGTLYGGSHLTNEAGSHQQGNIWLPKSTRIDNLMMVFALHLYCYNVNSILTTKIKVS